MNQKIIKGAGIILCEAVVLFVVLQLLPKGFGTELLLAFGTLLLVLVPWAMERLFHCEISLLLYLFCLAYALGPMLGHSCGWYYMGFHWDKVLHTFGGIAFAVLGLFLFERFVQNDRKNRVMTAAFGLCFSVAISVFWEFIEFAMDELWALEMQTDWRLADGTLDIGLHDTMWDMILESLGAFVTVALYSLQPESSRLIRPLPQKE